MGGGFIMDRIRVLIVSEDSSARRGLSTIFTADGTFEVLGGYSFDQSMDRSIELQPDVILVDISGGITNCMRQIKNIKKECPCSLIIALVDNEISENSTEEITRNFDSCIPKGIMRGCLIKSVELACRAGVFCLPVSFKKAVSISGNDKVVSDEKSRDGIFGTLTKREMEILHLMAKNFSNREIAAKLFISEPTVKTHVSSILRKLGQGNRAQAIIYSYKTGLISEVSVKEATY